MQASRKVGIVVAALVLTACGSSSQEGTPAPNQATAILAVPSIGASTNFSFDLGLVSGNKYYLTDRNNKAVDVVDLYTLAVSQIKGTGNNAFAGVGANNGVSGPDGINAITGTTLLYVGDVNFVRVIDAPSATVTGAIRVGSAGFRADEGCYDPDHGIYMISIPDADLPYAVFISSSTQAVIATVQWTDTDGSAAGGNEQCRYDHASQSFVVNNDNTIANPHGEVDVFPVTSISALPPGTVTGFLALSGLKRFPLGTCDPTGLDLGPGTDMAVECRQGDKGATLTTLILNRTTGAVITTIPFGGGDQLTYDARTNRYYVAASRWHSSGVNDQGGGCSAANLCTPTLGIIDASTRTLISKIATGNNAHSVAIDPIYGQIFVPFSSATSPAGCGTCAANGYNSGGIAVYFGPG
jgi:hypothetical protein